MGAEVPEPRKQVEAGGDAPGSGEVLTPDKIHDPGAGQEGRGVNADAAYPALPSVNLRRVLRRFGGGRRGGGVGQNTEKNRERDRNR